MILKNKLDNFYLKPNKMNKVKSLILALSLLFCISITTKAQESHILRIGTSLPLSDFGSKDPDNDNAGGAATGISAGFQYIYSITDNGLGIFAGMDIHYNALSKNVQDDMKKYFNSIGFPNAKFTFYKHINISPSTGLNYTYKADDKLSVFANGGLVINFYKMTNMVITVDAQEVTTSFNVTSSIGFRIGAGILLNDRITLSLDYWGLGNHDITGEMSSGGQTGDVSGKQKVDILSATLGLRF